MKNHNSFFSLILLLAFLLAACGGASTPEVMIETPDEPVSETAQDTMDKPEEQDEAPTPEAGTETMDDSKAVPAWFGAPLTDARTGQTFSISDFSGKVVLVETMAIWCSNCLQQQTQVKALHELLGNRDDFVGVGLDIDPNENVDALKGYIEKKGFDWYYAVPPVEVSREIASLYGDQFLNPPSTPIVVIDRHGTAHPLPFGIKSADELLKAVQPFLDESL